MNRTDFKRNVAKITKDYNIVLDEHNMGRMETPFGKVEFRCFKTDRQKYYFLHMRFMEDFKIEDFYRYFARHEDINEYSKKWNTSSSDAEYVLSTLEQRLYNLGFILQRDGKVATEPFELIL